MRRVCVSHTHSTCLHTTQEQIGCPDSEVTHVCAFTKTRVTVGVSHTHVMYM